MGVYKTLCDFLTFWVFKESIELILSHQKIHSVCDLEIEETLNGLSSSDVNSIWKSNQNELEKEVEEKYGVGEFHTIDERQKKQVIHRVILRKFVKKAKNSICNRIMKASGSTTIPYKFPTRREMTSKPVPIRKFNDLLYSVGEKCIKKILNYLDTYNICSRVARILTYNISNKNLNKIWDENKKTLLKSHVEDQNEDDIGERISIIIIAIVDIFDNKIENSIPRIIKDITL